MHSGEGKIADLAQSLQRSFEKEGSRADLVSAAEGSTPISSAPYDLVCLLSSFSGLFKPKVPVEIDNILKRCTRLEGKKGAAFVPAKSGLHQSPQTPNEPHGKAGHDRRLLQYAKLSSGRPKCGTALSKYSPVAGAKEAASVLTGVGVSFYTSNRGRLYMFRFKQELRIPGPTPVPSSPG